MTDTSSQQRKPEQLRSTAVERYLPFSFNLQPPNRWYVCTSAQHFNGVISKTKHWNGSCSPYNTWWSYENFVVLLHFSLENAAFNTGSREIAKGCTETNHMKKEDEQFGHSTSLDFYLPMVSSIFDGLVPNMEGIRAFFGRIFGWYYQYGHAWTIPTYSLLTRSVILWKRGRCILASKYCVGDEYRVLLHACGWYVLTFNQPIHLLSITIWFHFSNE